MDDLDKKIAALEAILFVHGEPIALKRLEEALGLEKEKVQEVVNELEKRLANSDRGLNLVVLDNKIQLTTKPEFAGFFEKFIKEELSDDLTPASLETLSIIAYKGPVSRSQIEYLRGVNSSFILRSLLIRGLIERSPDINNPGGFLYDLSFDAMKHLGIKSKRDLPDYDKFVSALREENQNH